MDEKDVFLDVLAVLVSGEALTVELNRLKHSERGILCEHSTSLTSVSSPDFPGW